MYQSQQKLCCGVDVETLRSFCHFFKRAIGCINRLKSQCDESSHGAIDNVMVNLEGGTDSLMDLCSDDKVIEYYAMHQSCFALAGHDSEACFHAHITDSARVQFLSTVSTPDGEFCNTMREIVSCAEKNVEKMCGQAASKLLPTLIKPMVRKSGQCDYHVAHSGNQKPGDGKGTDGDNQLISDQGKDKDKGDNNGNSSEGQGDDGSNGVSSLIGSSPITKALLAVTCSILVVLWKSHSLSS